MSARFRRSILIFLIGYFNIHPLWASPKYCAHLLTEEVAVSLANLREVINDTDNWGVRLRLEMDFAKKVSELAQDDPIEIQEILESLKFRFKNMKEGQVNSGYQTKEQAERRQQSNLLLHQPVDLSVEVETGISSSHLPRFDEQILLPKPREGHLDVGMMWSGNERFVAIRPTTEAQGHTSATTQIFDLQMRKVLDFSPEHGLMSSEGTLWAEFDHGQTVVSDFVTGKELRKVPGTLSLIKGPFLAQSLFTVQEGRTLWSHVQRGTFDVGQTYALSNDQSLLAFLDFGRLRIFRTATGNEVTVSTEWDYLEHSEAHTFTRGYYVFRQLGQSKIIFLDDLSIHDVPEDDPFVKLVPGTRWLRRGEASKASGTSHHFYNIPSLDHFSVKGLIVGESTNHMLFQDPSSIRTLVDMKTKSQKSLDVPYETILPGGRWLYLRETEADSALHAIYDLETEGSHILKFRGQIWPVPNSELWAFFDPNQGHSWLGYLENATNTHAELAKGHISPPGISPSGRYFVGVRGGQVVILARNDSSEF